jgi:S1-C subfamily serine protease
VVNLSPAVAEEVGVDPFTPGGVLVTGVARGLALNVGLRPGDIVREVNGVKITNVRALADAVATPRPGWR